MPQRWTLPGPHVSYLVVCGGDKEALDSYQHVPLWSVKIRLEDWSKSPNQNVQNIYSFLTGRGSTASRAASEEQIKHVLRQAFETGRLVVLENVITLSEVVVIGHTVRGIPFNVQGLELQVWIAMKMGDRTREQALALIRSGKVSELAEAKNSGKGFVSLSLSVEQYNLLKGLSTAASATGTGQGVPPRTYGSGQGATNQSSAHGSLLTPPSAEQRKSDAIIRERLKTRLYGLESLYRRYKAYRSLEKSLASIPSIDEFGVRDPNHSLIKTSITSAREELALLSRRSGFASIEDFKNTIQEYITAFQKETVAIGLDMMFKYDQVLQQEGNSYQDKARTTRLYQELKATEARKNYEQAESNETLANNIQPDPELHRYVAPGEWKMKQEAKRREAEYRARGNAEVNKVARNHPLLAQNDFNREELASSSPEGVRALMLGYIQSRRKDIRKAWNELVQNPGCIYMLDKLLQASRTIQEIQPGSIYDLILVDHAEALRAQQVVSNLLITVLALVVGLFTFGQGTVAIIAATVSVGLGAYAALEEFSPPYS